MAVSEAVKMLIGDQAVLIKTDGSAEHVSPAGKTFTLEELYKLIETDIIEVLALNGNRLAIFCEEGKLRDKPYNQIATAAAKGLGWVPIPGDVLVGNVVICPLKQFD